MLKRDKVMDARDIEDGIIALIKGDKEMAIVMFDRGMPDNGMRHRITREPRFEA